MAKAAKRGAARKTAGTKAKKAAAKPKKLKKAAKAAKSKAAPKRKPVKKTGTAAKAKAAPKRKPLKKIATATKAKAAPKPLKKAAPVVKAKAVPKPKPVAKAAKPTSGKPGASGLAPRFEDGRAFVVAGLGGRYSPATNQEIPALWQEFAPRWFGKVPGQVGQKSYGICYNFDDQGNLDYVAAVEVGSPGDAPAELKQVSIPGGRYAVFPHTEHVSAIGKTWMEIFQKWLPNSGRQLANSPSFELYSESFDPDVAIGGVEIWIPLQE